MNFMKYIIANWKANKNLQEVSDWVNLFNSHIHGTLLESLNNNSIQCIICPAFPYMTYVSEHIFNHKNILIGSQDIAPIEKGSYTGEVTAVMIQDFASAVIIGHSERRKHFAETDESVQKKTTLATQLSLTSIVCVRGTEDFIPSNSSMVAYEPVHAIGTGMNEPLDNVIEMKKSLKLSTEIPYLYGGSVTRDNAKEYIDSSEIDGLLIGSASLDPIHYIDIAKLIG